MSKNNKINELDETQVEFNISEMLKEPNEVFFPKNKALYDDFITSLEKLFPNKIMLNFKNFISSSKSTGGLIIIFTEEKINEVRNNLIRVANNKDVKKVTIFPILKESEVANKIIKILGVKRLPFYIFCKYKNEETVTMVYDIEKKFLLKDLKDLQNKFIPDSSISLDGENSLLNSNFFSEGSLEQDSISHLVGLLNNSISTLYDASGEILNFSSSSIEPQNSSINTQTTSNLSSFTINSNTDSNKITQNTTRKTAINNFIRDDDISTSKIKFTDANNKRYTIKGFNKTDKVSSLFDYVESLIHDEKSILNCSNFDLIYGYPGKSLSQLKNNTLMEEGLFPLSEVFIIKK